MIVGHPNRIPQGRELDGDEKTEVTLRKRAKYVESLRERHNKKESSKRDER